MDVGWDEFTVISLTSLWYLLLALNPAGDQEKSSVAYYFYKNQNFANIGNKSMNDALF